MFELKKLFLLSIFSALLSVSNYAFDNSDKLAEAQKRLEEAAREYAELSSEIGGDAAAHIVQSFRFSDDSPKHSKARLGINIGQIKIEKNINGETSSTTTAENKIDGVMVQGVSPDSPAEKAGLKSGDVITSLNGSVLVQKDDKSAVKQLTEIMQEVSPGEVVDIVYQRDGDSQRVSILTDEMPQAGFKMLMGDKKFSLGGEGDFDIDIQGLEGLENLDGLGEIGDVMGDVMGNVMGKTKFIFLRSSPLGDAELTELSSDLGEYFGTDEGLLVVKAPSDESIDLRDGDVIRSIDGRVPNSVNHAMRILRTYEEGEEVSLEILRKKRKRKITLLIPEKADKSNSKEWVFEKKSDQDFPLEKKHRVKVVTKQDMT